MVGIWEHITYINKNISETDLNNSQELILNLIYVLFQKYIENRKCRIKIIQESVPKLKKEITKTEISKKNIFKLMDLEDMVKNKNLKKLFKKTK